MTQEQDEALDESDLDQNVSQPDRDEVEQAHRTRLLASSAPRQRKNQKHQHGQQRNGQHHPQHGHAQINFPVDALRAATCGCRICPSFKVKKKNGALSVTGDTSYG